MEQVIVVVTSWSIPFLYCRLPTAAPHGQIIRVIIPVGCVLTLRRLLHHLLRVDRESVHPGGIESERDRLRIHAFRCSWQVQGSRRSNFCNDFSLPAIIGRRVLEHRRCEYGISYDCIWYVKMVRRLGSISWVIVEFSFRGMTM